MLTAVIRCKTSKLFGREYLLRCISTSNSLSSDYVAKINIHKPKKAIRLLTTITHSVPIAVHGTAVSKDESREFMSVFPDMVRELTEHAKRFESKDAAKWFAKALQYSVPNGKKNRGLATVLAYKMLASKEDLTEENIKLAQYLGWCVEMLQSMFLIVDDIMDGSQTRRGKECWYKKDEVGLTAINDGIMIENGMYFLLKKHFGDKSYYIKLVELFHEITFITTIGQCLDLNTSKLEVTKFTMERYKAIVYNKTAYYSFYLPVALAMTMTGYRDPEVYRQTKTILLEAGQFFQAQDDFLDCFGDPTVTGKVGTDIQDGKCTWLAVVCLQRASADQKQIMKECYGQSDPKKIQRIKDLYEELSLPSTYAVFEEESYNIILTHIQQISRGLPHELFFKIIDKIYRRSS